MKKFIILFFITSLYSLTISCPKMFFLSFNEDNLTIDESNSTLDSLKRFNSKNLDLAIIREDIINSDELNITNNFFILSTAKKKSFLYFIVRREKNYNSFMDLQDLNISVGSYGNLVGKYLRNFVNKKININFIEMNEVQSIDEVKNGYIDGAVIFGSKNLINTVENLGLKVLNLSPLFIDYLLQNDGFYDVMVKNISTVGINHYMIVSTNIFYNDIFTKSGNCQDEIEHFIRKEKKNLIDKKYQNSKEYKKFSKDEVKIKLISKTKLKHKIFFNYMIFNNSNETIRLNFDEIRTKNFDDFPFKARHIFNYTGSIEIKPKKSEKLLFVIKNEFAFNPDIWIYGFLFYKDKFSKKRLKILFENGNI